MYTYTEKVKKQIIENWGSIIQNRYGVTNSEMIIKMCLYAHEHTLYESGNDIPFSKTTLPLALKTLSKFSNMDKIEIVTDLNEVITSTNELLFDIPKNISNNIHENFGISIENMLEDVISNEIKDLIECKVNEMLRDNDKVILYTRRIIDEIIDIKEGVSKAGVKVSYVLEPTNNIKGI